MDDHLWVYGTGLAEPRFTISMRRQNQVAAISMAAANTGSSQPETNPEASGTPTLEVEQAQA